MTDKSLNELERYIDLALGNVPELKQDEKRRWLGEFRERVVFALTEDQIKRREAKKVLEEKIKNGEAKKLIMNMKIAPEISGRFMELAAKYDLDYKSVDLPNQKGDIALVLASDDAVNVENVVLEELPSMPDKFYQSRSRKLCKDHMEELKNEAPMYVDEFEEVTFFDKMVGIKCGVCEDNSKDGVMI
ncbi:YueI family protein [Geosporobacter ferrireducens]|uniref:DUF1694 domain-containing protein n=1 Tax=Geosporobacter ferrireducens TaxID=1424294 RepID=A0A1D8GGR1_9FIRM|nr:YueI family protein [Geosporobacter ferrireducens]AOT70066.1 hypothetical protein Gferi_10985 [Geosporobacter ferrireducens]MTI53386.1 DUF1694 domain-containing protein [Geosporobacter ferrireducens]